MEKTLPTQPNSTGGIGNGWSRSFALPAFAGVSSFFALVQLLTIALSLARLEVGRPVALTILVVSLVLSVLFARKFRGRGAGESTPPLPDAPPGKSSLLTIVLKTFAALTIAWAASVWVRLWWLAWHRPPYDTDGLAYHIPAMHEWVVRGHVCFINMPDMTNVDFPMGVELFTFVVHQLTGTSRLVTACNLWYWPLAFLALSLIAARMGVRGIWRYLAGGLIAGSPLFVSQSVSAYIDPGFAATVIAAVAASMLYVFDDRRRSWPMALLFGLNLGLMFGSKGFGLPFAGVLYLMTGAGLLATGRSRRSGRDPVRFLAAGLIVLAVGGYWNGRNAAVTGNFLYPFELKFGNAHLSRGFDYRTGDDAQVTPSIEKYPDWSRMFVAWLQPDAPIYGFGEQIGGWGIVWVAGGLPALLFLWLLSVRKRHRPLLPKLALLTVAVTVLIVLIDGPWLARLTLWIHAAGLPAFAVVLHDAVTRRRLHRAHFVTILIGLAVIVFAVRETTTTVRIEFETNRLRNDQGGVDYLPTLDVYFPGMGESPGFREFFRADRIARCGWVTRTGQLMSGMLSMPLGRREISILPPPNDDYSDPYLSWYEYGHRRTAPTRDEIQALRRNGVEWVLLDLRADDTVPESLSENAAEQYSYPLLEGQEWRLIRLRPDPGGV